MKILVVFTAILMLAGCSHTTYVNGPVKVTRWAFGTDIAVKPIKDKTDKFGIHTVEIAGINSDQSEAVGKAVEGAVTAIMKAAP